MEYNIIGDIAGELETTLALLDIMPKGATPVSVGDMVDRGPDSMGVLDFFMGNGLAVLGNHEHMMLDRCTDGGYYNQQAWFHNGGRMTVASFDVDHSMDIPLKYINYLRDLPLYLELEPDKDGVVPFVSHAARRPDWTVDQCTTLGPYAECSYGKDSILWNRGTPRAMPGMIQIFGHNSHWGLKRFDHANAICIDTSASQVLTGMHWPSREIFQVPFKEK
jgi:hypothetical protein